MSDSVKTCLSGAELLKAGILIEIGALQDASLQESIEYEKNGQPFTKVAIQWSKQMTCLIERLKDINGIIQLESNQ